MNLHEAATPTAAVRAADTSGNVRFHGNDRPYWRLLIRGAFLLMCTLGIYRFWLTTDVRRFLWGNTEIAGNELEYTGTALELLIGFLLAIAILVPVNTLIFIAALDFGILGHLTGALGFLLLAVLGQFALYRARRYRLSRTVYRGVRFHQTGSAWLYAIYALIWWGLIAITLGLAYPWAQMSLERFKMRHTCYGDLRGRFEGSALSLFLRGVPLWLLVIGPLAAGIVAAVQSVDWPALRDAVEHGGSGLAGRIEATNPDYGSAVVFAIAAVVWSVFAAALLYPAFQAMTLRWWIAGLRFGEASVSSHLRTGDVYRAYLRFLIYGIVFALAMAFVASSTLGAWDLMKDGIASQKTQELLAAGAFVAGYVIIALGYSTIYQATVKLALWRLSMDSAELSGVAALEHVRAAGRPTSALGEGLADALHVGGF
jgi:uncharacterized membrane protein YjgN (DUF898 family)